VAVAVCWPCVDVVVQASALRCGDW